jgi:hypothetical protein
VGHPQLIPSFVWEFYFQSFIAHGFASYRCIY